MGLTVFSTLKSLDKWTTAAEIIGALELKGEKMAYLVEIERNLLKGTGALRYENGTVSVNTQCWFELAKPIVAKTYIGCSATYMLTKKNSFGKPREGIYLPDKQTNRRGIFIHMGNNAAWSDGCIVIDEQEILKIWNSIHPKDALNITVTIRNV